MNPPPPVTRADRVRKRPFRDKFCSLFYREDAETLFLARGEDTAEAGGVVALRAPLHGPPIYRQE